MDEQIQLMTTGVKEWMEGAEQRLTKAKDELSLLESQERRLSGIWESGARQKWEEGFQKRLSEIRHWVTDTERLLRETQERAEALCLVEKELAGEAERL